MTRKPVADAAEQTVHALADSVQYQGRKASRQGSEQRRQAILDAAMRIIIREGVRAVRHRAVAAEAGVPLSATTYYFKDINDLITDTFAQFVERSAANLAAFWADAEGDLQVIAANRTADLESRRRMSERIVEMALKYVQRQLTDNHERLLAEQALRLEALINPNLRELANTHRRIIWRGVDRFFEALGSKAPFEDAQVLTSVILRMEYQGLLDGAEHLDLDEMRAVLRRYLYLIMGL